MENMEWPHSVSQGEGTILRIQPDKLAISSEHTVIPMIPGGIGNPIPNRITNSHNEDRDSLAELLKDAFSKNRSSVPDTDNWEIAKDAFLDAVKGCEFLENQIKDYFKYPVRKNSLTDNTIYSYAKIELANYLRTIVAKPGLINLINNKERSTEDKERADYLFFAIKLIESHMPVESAEQRKSLLTFINSILPEIKEEFDYYTSLKEVNNKQ